jgi:hypothetical protein
MLSTEAPKVLSDEELPAKRHKLATELSVMPSANQLHLKLSIGPNRARRLADQLAAEAASSPTATIPAKASTSSPRARGPSVTLPAPQRRPAAHTTGAQTPTA